MAASLPSRSPRHDATVTSPRVEGGADPFAGQRYLAQTNTRGIEQRVGDRGRHDGDCRLAGAGGLDAGPVDQDALDGGHLDAERQAVIAAPVDGGDAFGVPRDLLAKSSTEALE